MATAPLMFDPRGRGRKTATAGTAIVRMLWPRRGAVLRLQKLVYTAAGTAHTVFVMAPLNSVGTNPHCQLAAAAAASQAVIVLNAQPVTDASNDVAANDYVGWDNGDGTFSFDIVSSVSGLSITLTSNLSKALAAGAFVWFFGITTDTVPATGLVHESFTGTASATTSYLCGDGAIGHANGPFDPLLIYSANATAAGVLEQTSWAYTGP